MTKITDLYLKEAFICIQLYKKPYCMDEALKRVMIIVTYFLINTKLANLMGLLDVSGEGVYHKGLFFDSKDSICREPII